MEFNIEFNLKIESMGITFPAMENPYQIDSIRCYYAPNSYAGP
jgi:hypothetical protein